MNIERSIGSKKIAQRLADEMANIHPNSRHLFPDSSFMLFGPCDCDGIKIKSTRNS
jgi:hypothetical protein